MIIHLPTELAAFEPELKYFMDTMVRKLHANRHKGFGEAPLGALLEGLEDEVHELKEAARDESQFAVLLEGADVANFAFLVGLNAIMKTKEDWKKEQAENDNS